MRYDIIAANYQNWGEYYDTSGLMTEDEFDALTMKQRIALLIESFGEEEEEE